MFRFAAIWMILLLMPAFPAGATSVSEVTMDEMLQKSQFVFEGRVVAREAKQNSQRRIHTYVTFEIMDVIKGEYTGGSITLRFLGGTVGDVTLAVSDMRLPQEGEHGIYFVESLERMQAHPLFGWSQGHYLVVRDAAGIERVMTNRRLPVTGVKGAAPDQRTAKGREEPQAVSQGVPADLVVSQDAKKDKGLRIDEFKKALHEKMEKLP